MESALGWDFFFALGMLMGYFVIPKIFSKLLQIEQPVNPNRNKFSKDGKRGKALVDMK